jgi:hypothetical protein
MKGKNVPNSNTTIRCSFRVAGAAQGGCVRHGVRELVHCIKGERSDRGLDDLTISPAVVSSCTTRYRCWLFIRRVTGWCGGVNEAAADTILAAGGSADAYRIV